MKCWQPDLLAGQKISASLSAPTGVASGCANHVQHLSIWDYIACGASLDGRILENV